MDHLSSIVFATDFSDCAARAYDHAVGWARAYGAELHILHVRERLHEDPYHPDHHFPDPGDYEALLTRLDDEHMRAHVAPSDLRVVKKSVRDVSVASAVVDYVRAVEAGLVVAGTHGRRGLAHVLLGSIAEQIVRLCPCPVLTVGRADTHAYGPDGYRSVLAASDLSEVGSHAVAAAAHVARRHRARLVLMHAIEEIPHPAFYVVSSTSLSELFPDLRQRCSTALEHLRSEHAGDIECDIEIADGRPHRATCDVAQRLGTDLVVVGTHGYKGLERLLIGGVAAKILASSPCPVLTVK